jgi:hypothetical protein
MVKSRSGYGPLPQPKFEIVFATACASALGCTPSAQQAASDFSIFVQRIPVFDAAAAFTTRHSQPATSSNPAFSAIRTSSITKSQM